MNEPNRIVIEAMKTILDQLNGGNAKEIGATIHSVIASEHRTIQQKFWSAVLLAQITYADSRSDMRNQASVKFANVVKAAAIENNMDMGLPYI